MSIKRRTAKTSTPKSGITVLIDGDVIAYAVGFATQKKDDEGNIVPEPLAYALHSVKRFIEGVLRSTNAEHYKVYLTGDGNFRDKVATIQPYKGNRKNTSKPIHHKAIRDYMVKTWGAELIIGMEADDKLSIEQVGIIHGRD